MALIVVFENISKLADVSDYRVGVYVNHTQIHADTVLQGHKREDGWQALVKAWAKALKPVPYKPRRQDGQTNSKREVVRPGLPRGE